VAFHPQPLVPGQLGFVFQDPALIPWRTALANVRLPLELLGRQSPEDATARSSSVLTEVGLAAADHKKYPAQLSGGMRMRVSIARALVSDPSVLLMDEPFAALDDLLRGRLLELLQALWQRRRRTILFVTHNIAEALLLSQRVLVMNAGGVQGELSLPWPYPRRAELRGSVEFGEVYTQVSRHLAEAGNERPE
jgi:NitT/TauT family transport system ATP-binding protein